MKRIVFSLVNIFIVLFVYSQQTGTNLRVEQFTLENGLIVYLNEDHNIPSVLGAVIIKTGGKYDPSFATGTSHYLEHMLFKGTDLIGTVNYEEEKIYLDSIALKYDEIAETTDDEKRKIIQKQINELSLKAGEYAIPNELDRILDRIGSTNVNAFTSNEMVAYFNIFPKNQIEKWLYIYSTRFQNPVFRLFQSELETVFEEKNMYSDDLISSFIETLFESFYKNHPYGTQTILGSAEHIKNPSLTNMQKMYDTYYVANNMALVLTGNFKTEEIKPLIEKYFSKLKSGDVPEFSEYPEKPFDKVEIVKKRMTPIKVGVLGFRTVPVNHEDEIALEVCKYLLNNESLTGYFDKLNVDGKLLAAMFMNDIRNDHGGSFVLYIPKILGQSMNKAKKLIATEIEKLCNGEIDPEFLEAVKLEIIKNYQLMFENSINRAFLIMQLFIQNSSWEDILSHSQKIEQITIDDIQRVAQKYFNSNYLSIQSKMGFPKKDKLEKPGFDPIIPKNSEAKSEFALNLEKMPDTKSELEFIDFENDVETLDLSEGSKLYCSKNNINDIFMLNLKFNVGTLNDNRYASLANYISLIGTQNKDLSELNNELQKIGCSFYAYTNSNDFVVNITGFDKYFEESIKLIAELLNSPKADDSKLKKLREFDMFEKQYEKTNVDELSKILLEYGVYGENSVYLTRMSKKDVKKLKSNELINLLPNKNNISYNAHYSGSISETKVKDVILKEFNFKTTASNENYPIIREKLKYDENIILFLDNKKALQSQIDFYILGEQNDPYQRAIGKAFNHYFGSGMSSLVFQEIREFRSLAYSAYGAYFNGFKFDNPGHFRAFVGTQNDKAIEAISVMDSLINQMPIKENRLSVIKSSLSQSLNTERPDWRYLSLAIDNWQLQGYSQDPRKFQNEIIESLTFEQIVDFYDNNIKSRPMLITIVGNKDQINMKELSKFGKVIEIDKSKILTK